jgi:hypothetical protein
MGVVTTLTRGFYQRAGVRRRPCSCLQVDGDNASTNPGNLVQPLSSLS